MDADDIIAQHGDELEELGIGEFYVEGMSEAELPLLSTCIDLHNRVKALEENGKELERKLE